MKPPAGSAHLILLLLALVLLGALLIKVSGDRRRDAAKMIVAEPASFTFHCTACEHEWTGTPAETAHLYPGGMHNRTSMVPCVSCEKKTAIIETTCPWCKEGYIPAYLMRQPRAFPDEDICPHCKRDTLKWAP